MAYELDIENTKKIIYASHACPIFFDICPLSNLSNHRNQNDKRNHQRNIVLRSHCFQGLALYYMVKSYITREIKKNLRNMLWHQQSSHCTNYQLVFSFRLTLITYVQNQVPYTILSPSIWAEKQVPKQWRQKFRQFLAK